MPSSHCSLSSILLSPQISLWHLSSQPSPEMLLPSSHSSPASVFLIPSPQRDAVQLTSHAAVCTPHVSQASPTPVSVMQLPHSSFDWHVALQPSPLRLLPSSHVSPLHASVTPLPQVSSLRQSALQPSHAMLLPSSHCSVGSLTPLPHVSSLVQSALQPSPSTVLPS